MGFTGRLGSSDSQPGNVELGIDVSAQSFTDSPTNALGFNDSATEVAAFHRTVTDTLSLISTGVGQTDSQVIVNQSMSLSGVIVVEHDLPHDGSDTLSFGQSGTFVVEYARTISDTLSLSDGVVTGDIFPRTGTNTLAFSQDASGGLDKPASASNTLAFTEDLRSNFFIEDVADTLSFVEDINVVGPHYEFVGNTLVLAQSENGHAGASELVPDMLTLTQKVGRALTKTVTQSITFTDTGIRNNIGLSTLAFVQTVHVGKGPETDDIVDFVDTATPRLVGRRTSTNAMALTQSVAYSVIADCTKKDYSPFVGSVSSGITPPSATPPTLSQNSLTLSYPYVSPTVTVQLRNPAFNNKDRLNFNRINRETRGGTLIVYADPKWPKTQVLSVQIDALKQSQVDDLLEFLGISLGKEIGLLDWENRQWRGVITTPDATVTQAGRTDRSVVFDFQGVPV